MSSLPKPLFLVSVLLGATPAAAAEVDLSAYSRDCGVLVEHRVTENVLDLRWPLGDGSSGRIELNLDSGRPLVRSLGLAAEGGEGDARTIARSLDPAFFLTVGTRRTPRGKPDDQKWAVFFDNPVRRPHETFVSELERDRVAVRSRGRSATVSVGPLSVGSFAGRLELTVYPRCRLVQVEAAVRTDEDRRAIIYDAGLLGEGLETGRLVWVDTEGERRRATEGTGPLSVRYRTLVFEAEASADAAGGPAGALSCFPPPHQFQFPRDWTNNLGFVWSGRGHRDKTERFGFGVRQAETGGGNFVPWFNAPPGEEHRLGMFLLLADDADRALAETLRFTHGDSFPEIEGYRTFTSHWHMAIAVQAMEWKREGRDPLPVPDFVGMFKELGVDMVHLGEFHGDGHQKDPGPLRLPEVDAMFEECWRLSDDELLLIPGEEVNTFLGIREEGKHPGHWMSLFPEPVYWTMRRAPGQPFAEEHPDYGTVYHVGDRADMKRLLEREDGLVWSSHPRIKASSWTPDIFRHEDFYLADFWLGAAWKAVPADLSKERLGWRPLDLLSDMANWGQRKYLLGEVDVFKLDHTHELYSHMNINYLRMERLPAVDEGWEIVLDALRRGRFFTTTGEVLLTDFTAGGRRSGQELAAGDEPVPIAVDLEWTFPLRFALLVSGDGERVYRRRIDLSGTEAFGSRRLELEEDLSGRRWVRFEVWDVAANGAFTQPVWLAGEERAGSGR